MRMKRHDKLFYQYSGTTRYLRCHFVNQAEKPTVGFKRPVYSNRENILGLHLLRQRKNFEKLSFCSYLSYEDEDDVL